jgi:hypothetical protein
MKLVIREIHAASSATALNEEWFVVENVGDRPFSTAGVTIGVGRGQGKPRLRSIGTLDPGFTLPPGERVRIVTGNPGKKAHGTVPEGDALRNYHLFLAAPIVVGVGSVVGLSLHQHELARATYDPEGAHGLRTAEGAGA